MPSGARIRLKRSSESSGPRLELTPLIDVIFLILTFFLFSVTVMVRADVLGLDLPSTRSGAPAERTRALVLAVAADGSLRLDGEAVDPDAVGETVRRAIAAAEAEDVRPVLRVAVDERAPSGVLIGVVDALKGSGVERMQILGRPSDGD